MWSYPADGIPRTAIYGRRFHDGNCLVESPPPTAPVVSFGRPKVPWERIGSSASPTTHTIGQCIVAVWERAEVTSTC